MRAQQIPIVTKLYGQLNPYESLLRSWRAKAAKSFKLLLFLPTPPARNHRSLAMTVWFITTLKPQSLHAVHSPIDWGMLFRMQR